MTEEEETEEFVIRIKQDPDVAGHCLVGNITSAKANCKFSCPSCYKKIQIGHKFTKCENYNMKYKTDTINKKIDVNLHFLDVLMIFLKIICSRKTCFFYQRTWMLSRSTLRNYNILNYA